MNEQEEEREREQEQAIADLKTRVESLEATLSTLMSFIAVEGDTISIRAKGDVSIEALNFEASASRDTVLKGGASAEISAGGNTSVKGAMVMIN